jgi:hypothetical protein
MILLQNERDTLPLTAGAHKNFTIAIIGSQAVNPIVHGGGSGHVDPYYTSAPLSALLERLNISTTAANNCSEGHFEVDVDFHNTDDQTSGSANSPAECCSLCAQREGCNYFTYTGFNKRCWMKHTNQGRVQSSGRISGACHSTPSGGMCNQQGVCVTFDEGTDIGSATKTAAAADVAIIFIATTSHEGADRGSLSFDGNDDELVAAVAKGGNQRTIVAAVAPGAILTPWKNDVEAIILSFMPGQEYGNALTDILFGDINPSGKLPLTLPNEENECPHFSKGMWPGSKLNQYSNYSERLLIGYRCYDAFDIVPAFSFGHGLSYTNFSLSHLSIVSPSGRATVNSTVVHISVDITNTGILDGAQVVQLYVTFPSQAGEPPQQLKGMKKLMLKAGEKQTVAFALSSRAVSIWDVKSTGSTWKVVDGTFSISVGFSSRDHALRGNFTVG